MNNILAWVKSNWVVVLLSFIVLASLPAGILVSGSMDKRVQDDMQKKIGEDFNEVSKGTLSYTLPSPLAPGKPIIEFSEAPNKVVIDWFDVQRKALKERTDSVWAAAVKFNKDDHRMLVDGLFPVPDKLDEGLKRNDFVQALVNTVPAELLKRIGAGTPLETEKVAAQIREQYERLKLTGQNVGGDGGAQASDAITKRLVQMRLGIYSSRAGEFKVYADATAFGNFPAKVPAPPAPPPTVKQCWDYQEAIWIYEDLAKAVADANAGAEVAGSAGSGGVPVSIVKRIMRIDADPGPTGGGSSESAAATSAAAKSDGLTSLLNSDPAASLTGRISGGASGNQLYDVKVARLDLIVSSRRLPQFIDALTRANFLTVIGCDLSGDLPGAPDFDQRAHLDQGFYYGPEHVVRAVITVEAILFREWTKESMPPEIKTERGYAEPGAKPAAAAPAAEAPAVPAQPQPGAQQPPKQPAAPVKRRRGEEPLPD